MSGSLEARHQVSDLFFDLILINICKCILINKEIGSFGTP